MAAIDVPSLLETTPAGVRRLLREGTLVRLRRGVLVGACQLERAETDARLRRRLRLRAQLMTFSECVATHESAAITLDLPLFSIPAEPRISRVRGAWRGGSEVRVRIAPLPELHVFEQGGIRLTTLPRTAVDLARTLPFAESVVALDAVRRHCSAEMLRAALEECEKWFELGKARSAIDFADPRSESALESLSRAFMQDGGLPRPRIQAKVRGVSGRWYRTDFLWDESHQIGEADGAEKYADREALMAEKTREDDLREAGYGFVRWTYAEMVGRTHETLARISRRLR
jgi:hypothetical protein